MSNEGRMAQSGAERSEAPRGAADWGVRIEMLKQTFGGTVLSGIGGGQANRT
jgi:hypothetical protein